MFAFGSDSDDPSSSGKGKAIATKTHAKIQAMRTLGSGELKVQQLGDLIKVCSSRTVFHPRCNSEPELTYFPL